MLAPNEKQSFFDDGVIGPFKLYEPEEAKEILRMIRKNNLNKDKAIFNNEVNYDRHFDIPELAKHIGHSGIVKRVSEILGPDVFCWRSEFFPKFPGTKATEWHQVVNYEYANGIPMLKATQGADDDIVNLTVWTAFTDTTIDTACMRFLPGTHKARYYDEAKSNTGKGVYNLKEEEDTFFGYDFKEMRINSAWLPENQKSVYFEMKAGECIMFTSKCVHASYPNLSKTFTRFAIATRYLPTHVKIYPDLNEFHAHGNLFDLKDYGCILVSGKDNYNYNKVRDKDQHGVLFNSYFQK